MCPIIAASPIKHRANNSNPKYRAINNGIKLFKRSPTKVKTAAFLLPVLSILVAPGLPEPNPLGSGKFSNRAIKIELDIEPIKYIITMDTM